MPVAQVRTSVTRRRTAGRRLQAQDKPTFLQWITRRRLQNGDESFDVLAQFGTDLFADAQSAFDTLSPLLNDPTMKAQLACALGVCGQILSTSALQMLVADQADDYEGGSGSGSGADSATVEPPSSPPPSPPSGDDDAPSSIAIPIAVAILVFVVLIGVAYFAGACNGVFARPAPNAAGTPVAVATVAPANAAASAQNGDGESSSFTNGVQASSATMTQPLLGGRAIESGRKARYQKFRVSF